MGIREISSTERRRGSLSLVQVVIDDVSYKLWQLTCAACDSIDMKHDENEGLRLMLDHVCPDVPLCEGGSKSAAVLSMIDKRASGFRP